MRAVIAWLKFHDIAQRSLTWRYEEGLQQLIVAECIDLGSHVQQTANDRRTLPKAEQSREGEESC